MGGTQALQFHQAADDEASAWLWQHAERGDVESGDFSSLLMMLPQTYGVTDPYLQERLANHVYTFRMYQRVAYMLERRGDQIQYVYHPDRR